jgi:hypothetical protein
MYDLIKFCQFNADLRLDFYLEKREMKINRSLALLCILSVLVAGQLACSTSGASSPTPTRSAAGTQTTVTEPAASTQSADAAAPGAAATSDASVQKPSTVSIQVDAPAAGKANAIGRVYWNGKPVAATDVKLCNDVGMVSGCEESGFSAKTDDQGNFALTNVTPGEYVIVIKVPQSDNWVYVTEGYGVNAHKIEFVADKTTTLEDQTLIRFDLKPLTPREGEQVSKARPTLTWEAYPDAASYEVYLSPENGQPFSETVSEASYTPPADLLDCKFSWKIQANNAAGEEIAEFEEYVNFEVTGQAASCHLNLTAPADGAALSGSGIKLSWEAHPLADHYLVYVTDKDYKNIIDGVEVTGTSYDIPDQMAAGEYQWYINAYKGSDSIAVSPFYGFTVSK